MAFLQVLNFDTQIDNSLLKNILDNAQAQLLSIIICKVIAVE